MCYTFKNEVMPTLGATHLFPLGNMKIQFSSDQGLCSALDLAYHILTTTSALLTHKPYTASSYSHTLYPDTSNNNTHYNANDNSYKLQ